MCLCNLQQRPAYQQHSCHAERVSAVCVCALVWMHCYVLMQSAATSCVSAA